MTQANGHVPALPGKVSGTVESGGPQLEITVCDLTEENAPGILAGLPHSKTLTRFEVWRRVTTHQGTGKWEPHSQWGNEEAARGRIENDAQQLLTMPYPCTFEYAIIKAVSARALHHSAVVVAFVPDR